jgi:putative spermidine/putrescine transport system permease protein
VITRRSQRKQTMKAVGLVAVAFVLLLPFFLGIAEVIRSSVASNGKTGWEFGLGSYERLIKSGSYWDTMGRTLKVATWAAPLTVLLAYPVAYAMAGDRRRLGGLLMGVMVGQILIGYVIRTYGVLILLARQGPVNWILSVSGLTREPLQFLFRESAVILGVVVLGIPLAVFPVYAALLNIPRSVREAALVLGARPRQVFWMVTVPLSAPGIGASLGVAYAFGLTSYVAPGLLGGGFYDMLANFVYDRALGAMDWGGAAAAGVSLMVTGLMVTAGLGWMAARAVGPVRRQR